MQTSRTQPWVEARGWYVCRCMSCSFIRYNIVFHDTPVALSPTSVVCKNLAQVPSLAVCIVQREHCVSCVLAVGPSHIREGRARIVPYVFISCLIQRSTAWLAVYAAMMCWSSRTACTHDVILCVVSRFFVRGAGHREAQGAQMLYAARVYLVSPSRTTGIEVHAMWPGCVRVI